MHMFVFFWVVWNFMTDDLNHTITNGGIKSTSKVIDILLSVLIILYKLWTFAVTRVRVLILKLNYLSIMT